MKRLFAAVLVLVFFLAPVQPVFESQYHCHKTPAGLVCP